MKKTLLNLSKILFLFASISLLNSCDKDDKFEEEINNNLNTGSTASSNEVNRLEKVLTSNTITTNLSITVVNEDDLPINNASLQIENTTSVTDENGYTLIENIEVNEHFQVIKTQSTGYVTSIKTITPSSNGITNVSITLLKPTFEKSFDANDGGIISNDILSIEFPSDAIADQNGDLYEGDVNVTVTYYDPNATSFSATIPGTLVGLDDNDSLHALISKGMIKVDLTDSSGNELEIFEGKEATITLPANDNDPDIIDFWHLNEEKGIWVQTVTATKVGNTYVATVTHFSTYNLDVKVPAIDINFIIKDADGNFIANEEAEITATLDDETYSRKITTDNNGAFSLINAPQNAEYSISFSKCEESSIVSAGVISESTTKELTVNSLNSARFIQLEGVLYGCDNEVLTNKAFVIEIENNGVTDRITTYANAIGVYSTTSWLCNYDTTTTYQAQIRVFDGDNDILSNTEFIFNTTNYLTKEIIICNGIIEYVEERVFYGDLIIDSDEKLQEFSLAGYTKITGGLFINNISTTDLNDLENLTFIGGVLQIYENENLINLKGLENLNLVLGTGEGSIHLAFNPNLIDLEGLGKVKNVSIWIRSNDKMTSLNGLENIDVASFPEFYIYLTNNKSLTDISGLRNVTQYDLLEIRSNTALENLTGLDATSKIGYLNIRGNDLLTNLDALNNVTTVNNLNIEHNDSLTDFCGLNKEKISSGDIFIAEDNNIDDNAYNPTIQDLIDGNCSQ